MNEALLRARKAAKLTKAALEREAGLTPGTVYDLETERVVVPGFDTGTKILRVLERYGVPKSIRERVFPVEVAK